MDVSLWQELEEKPELVLEVEDGSSFPDVAEADEECKTELTSLMSVVLNDSVDDTHYMLRNEEMCTPDEIEPETATVAALSGDNHSTLIQSGKRTNYSCDLCAKIFTQESDLINHLRFHSAEKPFACGECGHLFRMKGHLTRHLIIHTGEQTHKCVECGMLFSRSESLKRHLTCHSGTVDTFSCTICGRRFKRRGELHRHMTIHSGEKPFKCKECGKAFRLKGEMEKHSFIHTGEKPYACLECGKKFSRKESLMRHLAQFHRSQVQDQCDACGKAFNIADEMMNISTTLPGGKSHCCGVCSKSFSLKVELRRHIWRVHAIGRPSWCLDCARAPKKEGLSPTKQHLNTNTKTATYKGAKEGLSFHNSCGKHYPKSKSLLADKVSGHK